MFRPTCCRLFLWVQYVIREELKTMTGQDVMIEGLSDRIREQRKQMGITQGELAKRIGGGIKTINDYERGARQPSYERLLMLARLFGVSTDYLLGVNTDRQ